MGQIPARTRPALDGAGAPSSWLPLPRLSPRFSSGDLVLGAGALLVLMAVGAALVHLVDFHLGLGSADRRVASIQFMLAHCPLRGGLLIVLTVAALTALALLRELRLLLDQRRRLTLAARQAGLVTPRSAAQPPLRAARFVVLFLPLLVGQLGLSALAARFWPMTFAMRMHGVLMDMTVRPALPVLPLHVVVALLLAAFIWRLERRFTVLHAAIATVRRLLARALSAMLRVLLPPSPPAPRLSLYGGPATLSRPPPA